MPKNKKVMSIAIKPELQDQLKDYARRKGQSLSAYLGSIAEQVIKLNIDDDPMLIGKPIDEDVIPVVLKIPAVLKSNPEKFKQWMEVQSNGIVKAMTKDSQPEGND